MDTLERITQAVLYEGYLLWPYRRSALKNQQRWTFGGLYPQPYLDIRDEGDASALRLQCLVEGPASGRVEVTLRFLHVLDRQPLRAGPDGPTPVDALVVDDEQHLAWQEATERRFQVAGGRLAELTSPARQEITVRAETRTEPIRDRAGREVGGMRRTWEGLAAVAETSVEPLGDGLQRLTVDVRNASPWAGDDRAEAVKRTLCSSHLVVRATGARLVSLTDPPAHLRPPAEDCENVGVWPVLVGKADDRHTMLASPIILPDHPQVAPESPGDLFDGCEVDELLVHSIRALTEEERREIRATDPRVREILDRTDNLPPEQLQRLHGAIREFRPLGGHA